jgi:hypothetical protein
MTSEERMNAGRETMRLWLLAYCKEQQAKDPVPTKHEAMCEFSGMLQYMANFVVVASGNPIVGSELAMEATKQGALMGIVGILGRD